MIMPTEIVRASIDIMFSVKPIADMKVKVAMIVVGIVMAATNEPRKLRRKKTITSTASSRRGTTRPGPR